MGMWVGIKHALNDTLGTSNFKPLNKILNDSRDNINSTVNSARDNINSTVNSARDNINSTVNNARDNIKTAITNSTKTITDAISSYLKSVVNSTFGTSQFKPLDKLILDSRSWGASDAVTLATFSDISLTGYNQDILFGKFSSELGGTLRLKVLWRRTNSSVNLQLKLFMDGVHIQSFPCYNTTAELEETNFEFRVVPNSEYTLYVNASSYTGASISYVKINGVVLNSSAFNYEEI